MNVHTTTHTTQEQPSHKNI